MHACDELRNPHKAHCDVNWRRRMGKSLRRRWRGLVGSPNWNCDIAGTATIDITEETSLLHDRREHPLLCDSVQQVSNTVVAMYSISRHCAAGGVVAKNINDLLAQ